jgi:hypothetical protein
VPVPYGHQQQYFPELRYITHQKTVKETVGKPGKKPVTKPFFLFVKIDYVMPRKLSAD